MAANLTDIMDQIGVGLATISGLTVMDYPTNSGVAPFAFVDLPETIDFDTTSTRKFDRITLKVFVAVSNVIDQTSRDELVAYAASSGTKSVKAALDAATVGETTRVTRVEFGPLLVAGTTYVGAVFYLDVLA